MPGHRPSGALRQPCPSSALSQCRPWETHKLPRKFFHLCQKKDRGSSPQGGCEAPSRQCRWERFRPEQGCARGGCPCPSAGQAYGKVGQKATNTCTSSPFMARNRHSPLQEHGDVPHSKKLAALPLLPTPGPGPTLASVPAALEILRSYWEGGGFPTGQAQSEPRRNTAGGWGAAGSSPKARHSPHSQSGQIQGHLLPAPTILMGTLRHGGRGGVERNSGFESNPSPIVYLYHHLE